MWFSPSGVSLCACMYVGLNEYVCLSCPGVYEYVVCVYATV